MAFADYKRDLIAEPFNATRMLHQYFHSGQSHVFHGAPPAAEPTFKMQLGHRLRDSLNMDLHPLQLVICGSAHLGFSPVPHKLGNPFNPSESDIDVAVVSTELFDLWWNELQTKKLVPAVTKKVAENLFWGFIYRSCDRPGRFGIRTPMVGCFWPIHY